MPMISISDGVFSMGIEIYIIFFRIQNDED
jgi:hypothetical protein